MGIRFQEFPLARLTQAIIYLLYLIWSRNALAIKRAENIVFAALRKWSTKAEAKIDPSGEELLILEFLIIVLDRYARFLRAATKFPYKSLRL